MANKIQSSSTQSSAFVDVTSRYLGSEVIYYGDDHITTFKSYKRQPPTFSSTDKTYLITAATQYRPDIVSNLAYGLTSFWWRILEANNMKDIYDFKMGITIRIPESVF